jgi:hypothetical protein
MVCPRIDLAACGPAIVNGSRLRLLALFGVPVDMKYLQQQLC